MQRDESRDAGNVSVTGADGVASSGAAASDMLSFLDQLTTTAPADTRGVAVATTGSVVGSGEVSERSAAAEKEGQDVLAFLEQLSVGTDPSSAYTLPLSHAAQSTGAPVAASSVAATSAPARVQPLPAPPATQSGVVEAAGGGGWGAGIGSWWNDVSKLLPPMDSISNAASRVLHDGADTLRGAVPASTSTAATAAAARIGSVATRVLHEGSAATDKVARNIAPTFGGISSHISDITASILDTLAPDTFSEFQHRRRDTSALRIALYVTGMCNSEGNTTAAASSVLRTIFSPTNTGASTGIDTGSIEVHPAPTADTPTTLPQPSRQAHKSENLSPVIEDVQSVVRMAIKRKHGVEPKFVRVIDLTRGYIRKEITHDSMDMAMTEGKTAFDNALAKNISGSLTATGTGESNTSQVQLQPLPQPHITILPGTVTADVTQPLLSNESINTKQATTVEPFSTLVVGLYPLLFNGMLLYLVQIYFSNNNLAAPVGAKHVRLCSLTQSVVWGQGRDHRGAVSASSLSTQDTALDATTVDSEWERLTVRSCVRYLVEQALNQNED